MSLQHQIKMLPRNKSFIIGIIILTALVVACAIVYCGYMVYISVHVFRPLNETVAELRYEAVSAHLLIKDIYINADKSDIGELEAHFIKAQKLIQAMSGKIESLQFLPFLLKNYEIKTEARSLQKAVDSLDAITRRELSLHLAGLPADTLDKTHDALFAGFRKQAYQFELCLQLLTLKEINSFATIQTLLFLFSFVGATILIIIYRRYERRRTGYLNDLQSSHQQLHSNEQQLLSINRQLLAEKDSLRIFQKAIEHADECIAAVTSTYEFIFGNASFRRYFQTGQAQISGKSMKEVLGDETFGNSFKNFINRCLSGERIQQEVIKQIPNLGNRTLQMACYPLNGEPKAKTIAIAIIRDITDRTKIENERQKAQKLESIGILAGGIAHDFNNFLTGIFLNIGMARIAMQSPKEAIGHLDQSLKAFKRAADLTQQLLTFSKGGAPVKKVVSIEPIVRESANFSLAGSNVQSVLRIDDNLWPVEIDEGQIHQVLTNMLINARQAMPDGGIVTLQVANCIVGSDDLPQLKAGHYLQISIIDQGCGILPEHLPKIFDPFFTTKQNGSGLGLATSYSIVKRHEGHVSVASQVSKGTTVHIYLPATNQIVVESKVENIKIERNYGTILLMDDEELVREVTKKVIEQQGFTVLTAKNGKEAIDVYKREAGERREVRAVLLDLTIPGGMGGKETILRLRELFPTVPALAISGYSDDPVFGDCKAFGFDAAICKPYQIQELQAALQRLLKTQTKK